MINNKAAASRNYGIDLLRMVSMFLVAILHTLGQGGVIGVTGAGTASYAAVWFLETAAYCAVNCYALISGYVSVKAGGGACPGGPQVSGSAPGGASVGGSHGKSQVSGSAPGIASVGGCGFRPVRYRFSRFLNLWLEVTFYTVTMTVIFAVACPGAVGIKEAVSAFFPLLTKQYWYFNAYFVLFLAMPFVDRLIEVLSKKDMQLLLGGIGLGFSILPTIANKDIFVTGKGYSGLWLICLYIIGAYIKLYMKALPMKKWQSMGLYIVCVAAAWLWKIVDLGQVRNLFIHYTSPFILLAAVSLLLFFRDCRFGPRSCRLIALLSPAAFGVYLIHVNPLFWEHVMKKAFVDFKSLPPAALVLAVLAAALCIYAVGSLIDVVRIRIFNGCRRVGQKVAHRWKTR